MTIAIKPLAGLLAYCRAGFESELRAELRDIIRLDAIAQERPQPQCDATICGEGVVAITCDPADQPDLIAAFATMPIFARQLLALRGEFELRVDVEANNSEAARVITGHVLAVLEATLAIDNEASIGFEQAVVEQPDTNDGRALSSLTGAVQSQLREHEAMAGADADPDQRSARAHVLLIPVLDAPAELLHVFVASAVKFSPPWPMGVARIRVSSQAPSRSAAKLAEAFYVLVGDSATARVLKPGMRAVDLGAAPGGWSWWLASKGLRVAAVDNGPLKGAAYKHAMIEHLKTDGFKFKPTGKVDWLVCDMVERPNRVAELIGLWFSKGWTRNAVFNLKLPMKLRLKCVRECEAILRAAIDPVSARWSLQIRQLYHDREEVTVVVMVRD
jgi:23S rRNA (cytidine2498-2'-O)-methyltransferase